MPGTEPQSSSNGIQAQRPAPGMGTTRIAAATSAPPRTGIHDGALSRFTRNLQKTAQFRSEIHAPVRPNSAKSVHSKK